MADAAATVMKQCMTSIDKDIISTLVTIKIESS